MGEEPAPAAIADAGPIIHLYEISRLSLLGIFSRIEVCQAVWNETIVSGRVPEAELMEAVSVRRHVVTADNLTGAVGTFSLLHRGEMECLALCRNLGMSLLLTDDLAARVAAAQLGIHPVGSLGIIVRAFHMNLISFSDAEQGLERLYLSSLYVTRAVIELALEQLRT